MYQNRLRLGLRQVPAGGAYSASPDPAGYKGPIFKGMEGVGRGKMGREGKGEQRGRVRIGNAKRWQPYLH